MDITQGYPRPRGVSAHDAWMALGLPPATPEQLKKLAELHGLVFEGSGSGHPDMKHRFRLRAPSGSRICTFFPDSHIERYIAAIREWKAGQP